MLRSLTAMKAVLSADLIFRSPPIFPSCLRHHYPSSVSSQRLFILLATSGSVRLIRSEQSSHPGEFHVLQSASHLSSDLARGARHPLRNVALEKKTKKKGGVKTGQRRGSGDVSRSSLDGQVSRVSLICKNTPSGSSAFTLCFICQAERKENWTHREREEEFRWRGIKKCRDN